MPDEIAGKAVRIWTDNAGGESALRKGAASTASLDHNAIIHITWLIAARAGAGLFVHRVPTKLNLADDPSRSDYRLLQSLGATWYNPVFPVELWSPASHWLDP